ncbi:MAG: hypothetical protein ABIR08_02870 [Sphingomonas sp.]
MVPTDGFEVTQGEAVIGGIHGDQGQHNHCDWCKSWLFTRTSPTWGSSTSARRCSTIRHGSCPSPRCSPARRCPGRSPARRTPMTNSRRWRTIRS